MRPGWLARLPSVHPCGYNWRKMAQSGVSAKQQRAIVALLDPRNSTQEAAARAAGVGYRTLQRWLTEPAFVHALRQAEGQAVDAATRRLLSLQSVAISVFGRVLTDKDIAPSVRLRAAQQVIDFSIRLTELRSIEERLTALENRL